MADEQYELYTRASEALGWGDLAPLLAYLESPYPLDHEDDPSALRSRLVRVLKGQGLFRIEMKRTRRGRGPKTEEEERLAGFDDLTLVEIAPFVEDKVASGVPVKVAVWEAQQHFKKSRTAVYAAMKGAKPGRRKSKQIR